MKNCAVSGASASCVPTKQVEGIAFRDGAMLTGVFRVDVGHVVPRDARDGFPVRELAGEIDFQRVHACHVMDHYADRAAVRRHRGPPLRVGETLGERPERPRPLLDPLGEGFSTLTHRSPRQKGHQYTFRAA